MKESATRVGFALCGSFCTFSQVITQIDHLCTLGYDVYPIMSSNAYDTDTRFGNAQDHITTIESITGHSVWHTIDQVEPIGPKKILDILTVAPCTGNTIGKLANGIYDTAVTLAVKAHLRNDRPVVIAVSTNDGLSGSARNIGCLHNMKNMYFVPYRQDDPVKKPMSLVAHMDQIPQTIALALQGKQIQPMLA